MVWCDYLMRDAGRTICAVSRRNMWEYGTNWQVPHGGIHLTNYAGVNSLAIGPMGPDLRGVISIRRRGDGVCQGMMTGCVSDSVAAYDRFDCYQIVRSTFFFASANSGLAEITALTARRELAAKRPRRTRGSC